MRAIDHVVRRFPDRVDLIRRLYLRDERFRSICADYSLSVCALRRFERRPDAAIRPEADDYRLVLGELEDEIRGYLARTWGD